MAKECIGQIDFFDLLKLIDDTHEDIVYLNDMCQYKNGHVYEYEVPITYADGVLLISMLHDYVQMLGTKEDARMAYYCSRFENLAKKLEQGIHYDYEKQLEKCRQKIKDDRLDENWIGR